MFAKYFVVALSAFVAICGANSGLTFPDDPKPCKYGDAECIGKIIDLFVKEKPAGEPEIGLNAFDPLEVKKLHIARGDDSPVRIDLMLTNGNAYGLKTAKFQKLSGFGKEITGKHEITVKVDYVTLLSDYKIHGQVLILPIRGEGKSNLTIVNPDVTFGWHGVPVEKNGSTYMKVEKYYVDIAPKSISFGFENLFNDKALSDNMNKFLGDNWVEVYGELRESLIRGISPVTRNIWKGVFAKFPYDKLFAN